MQNIRAGYRLVLFVFFSISVIIIFCLGLPFCLLKKELKIRWKNALISRWASIIAVLMGAEINIKGQPPKPPFFLVSNHLSYIDILPFWKHLKTTFIAKNEIKSWPFFGQAAALLGIIFIDRKNRKDLNRVNTLIEHHMSQEQGIILFPEGTSSKGEKVLPFKSSLLYYPASKNLPVYYASISYNIRSSTTKKAYKHICWWGDMDFLTHFWGLLKIKSWTAHVRFSDKNVRNKNRKILATSLHQKTKEIFIPTLNK